MAAVRCAAGVWLCAKRVMIPHHVSVAAARGLPRANHSAWGA